MFTIESLWKIEALRPLQKAYEADQNDRRLVVVADGSNVDIAETEALHGWLESTRYLSIPAEWETADLDVLPVVHISKLTLTIVRRDPFGTAPLTPNSWLNRLPQERFDAILLAQELGDLERQPSKIEIKDRIKPMLEVETMTGYWADTVALVKFATSGAAPRTPQEKKVAQAWQRVESRRHYDPSDAQVVPLVAPTFPDAQPSARQSYNWGSGTWTPQMTALRDWITVRLSSTEELRAVAFQILGTISHIQITGRMQTDVHALVREASLRVRLDDLANHFGYVQDGGGMAGFNQAGQTVHGQQVNISGGINTAGGMFNVGNVVVGGDFIGGNIVTGANVVIGKNITQIVNKR